MPPDPSACSTRKVPEGGAWLQRAVHGRHVERRNALGIEEVFVRKVERGDQRFDLARAARRRSRISRVEKRVAFPRIDVRQRQEDRVGGGKRHGCLPGAGWSDRSQGAIQPRPRKGPLVLDGRGGEVERRGGFLDAQAREVPEGHDLRLARVGLLEARQRLVNGDEIGQAPDRRA